MIIVAWSLLGFPLAFHKAVLAPTLVWAGVEMTVASGSVTGKVPATKVAELKLLLQDTCKANVVSKKAHEDLDWQSHVYCFRHSCLEAVHSGDVRVVALPCNPCP